MTVETTVNTRGAQRLAVLEAVRNEIASLLTPIEGGALDGIQVVSKGEVDQAIANVKAQPLPPIDSGTAEVKTPADVYVDAICPECELPTRLLIQLSAVLETTREAGSSIKLKAKVKARGHVHHQLALDEGEETDQQDFGLEDIVRPEDALSDDDVLPDTIPLPAEGVVDLPTEPDASDQDAEAAAVHQLHAVPAPEPLSTEAATCNVDVAGQPCCLKPGHEGDHDPFGLPW